ncbi:Sulphur transport protein [Candidatus Planktophila dulcis]|uniref:Sulphur transport protein n=1 Tax=Candidatus Planktophila dulcis TaxID=1884914 RepID=A0AAC9YSS7_9ACTN|nr:Sulphur transport protein [Candidatus Planktophila dulcis]
MSFAVIAALLLLAFILSSNTSNSTAPISLLIGMSLGLLLERGRFCFFCIFRDGIEDKNTTPFLSVLVAIATGSVGYALIFGQFLPDTSTDRLPPVAHIGPVSWVLVVAAFAFGIGMSLSGACISGHLYRLGQGYLRAIPALIGTLIGFVLAFLSWNWLYLNAISDAPTIWLPHYVGYSGALLITLSALLLLAFIAIRRGTNSDPIRKVSAAPLSLSGTLKNLITERWSPIATGAIAGVLGTIAYLRVEPLGVTRQLSTTARTFMDSNKIGPESLVGLDRMAGCVAVVAEAITNNGWLVIGIIGTSFAAALAGGRFKFSRLTPTNSATALIGGILLGWGSMTSLGCTIGVLLSGTQAFALSGWVFFAFVFLGSFVGIKLKFHTTG